MEIQSDVVFLYLKVMARGLPYDFKSVGKGYLRYRGFVMKFNRVRLYMSKFYCQGALVYVN